MSSTTERSWTGAVSCRVVSCPASVYDLCRYSNFTLLLEVGHNVTLPEKCMNLTCTQVTEANISISIQLHIIHVTRPVSAAGGGRPGAGPRVRAPLLQLLLPQRLPLPGRREEHHHGGRQERLLLPRRARHADTVRRVDVILVVRCKLYVSD